jgi:8-oxo-dGTP pyrophosphatase MutT (NUDIX family)
METAFLSKLKQQLKLSLPGIGVQWEMAHVNRENMRHEDLHPDHYRNSAVLILLVKRPNGFCIPLIERHIYKGAHSGQISLPGGKFDESDITLETTALRECHEEIGIQNNIEVYGELTPIYIPVSKFMVTPFVAVLNEEDATYILNVNEVQNVIEFPVEDLRSPHIVKETTIEPTAGIKLKTPYFDIQGKIVWGATAMILNEFKHLLLKL